MFGDGTHKIIELKSRNVKRLRAVTIRPDGSTVVIGGANDQGKSSVLDSIMYALGGGHALPEKPLRRGAEDGEVRLDLGDIEVVRTFQEDGGSELVVRSTEHDAKLASPQSILDKLCASIAFDPLEFARKQSGEQVDLVKQAGGLDFEELDEKRAELYQERRDTNRELRKAEAALDEMPQHEDAPDELVAVDDLVQELERRQAHNSMVRDARSRVDTTADDLEALEEEVEELERRLARKREQAEAKRQEYEKAKQAADEMDEEGVAAIREQISQASEINEKVRENEERENQLDQVGYLRGKSEELTEKIEAIDEQKRAAMQEADWPLEGLGFDESGVTMDGLPFDQASQSERLRASVAMGLAMNPKLRVLLIRDGSLLDENSLAMVAEMAEEADAQVWIERVSQGDEVSVIIEDGMVRQQRAEMGAGGEQD